MMIISLFKYEAARIFVDFRTGEKNSNSDFGPGPLRTAAVTGLPRLTVQFVIDP